MSDKILAREFLAIKEQMTEQGVPARTLDIQDLLPESRKHHAVPLILSFILSNKGYDKLARRLKPVLQRLGTKLPDTEEYQFLTTNQRHDHTTPLRALFCLNNECLRDDTRRGIRLFFEVHFCVFIFETLWMLTGQIKRRPSLKQIYQSISTRSSRQIALIAASYSILFKALYRCFQCVFGGFFRGSYELYQDQHQFTLHDRILQSLNWPPARVTYQYAHATYGYVHRSPMTPAFLGGFIAGRTILLASDQDQRVTISVYVLIKSFQYSYNALRDNGIIGTLPRWCGSWLLFPISSAQLIYAYLLHPDTFPESYDRFITNRSTTYIQPKPVDYPKEFPWPSGREIVNSISKLALLNYPKFYSPKLLRDMPALPENLEPIQPILKIAHPAHTRTLCAVLHPEEPSCLVTFSKFVSKEGVAALKFMGIINAIGLLLRWKHIRNRPYESMMHWANHSVPLSFKGATFITMAIATAWGMICGFQSILPNKFMPISRIYLNGFIGGLWIFAEDPNRRLDIGLYGLRLSLESLWKLTVKKGIVKPIKNGEALIFSLAMGVIMALWQTQPRTITSPYIRYCIKKVIGPSQAD